MLHVLQVYSQRGEACETNVLHVWIQFHGALRTRNAHITVYHVTTWSWVNLVHPSQPQFRRCTSRVLRPMIVVFGLGTRLRVCMRTTLENGVLHNGQQPQSVVNGFY